MPIVHVPVNIFHKHLGGENPSMNYKKFVSNTVWKSKKMNKLNNTQLKPQLIDLIYYVSNQLPKQWVCIWDLEQLLISL